MPAAPHSIQAAACETSACSMLRSFRTKKSDMVGRNKVLIGARGSTVREATLKASP